MVYLKVSFSGRSWWLSPRADTSSSPDQVVFTEMSYHLAEELLAVSRRNPPVVPVFDILHAVSFKTLSGLTWTARMTRSSTELFALTEFIIIFNYATHRCHVTERNTSYDLKYSKTCS